MTVFAELYLVSTDTYFLISDPANGHEASNEFTSDSKDGWSGFFSSHSLSLDCAKQKIGNSYHVSSTQKNGRETRIKLVKSATSP